MCITHYWYLARPSHRHLPQPRPPQRGSDSSWGIAACCAARAPTSATQQTKLDVLAFASLCTNCKSKSCQPVERSGLEGVAYRGGACAACAVGQPGKASGGGDHRRRRRPPSRVAAHTHGSDISRLTIPWPGHHGKWALGWDVSAQPEGALPFELPCGSRRAQLACVATVFTTSQFNRAHKLRRSTKACRRTDRAQGIVVALSERLHRLAMPFLNTSALSIRSTI